MEKLIFIAGQLHVEIRARELDGQQGYKRIITDTSITLGGRAYRQAIYSKELGMNVILLGRIGDDDHGKMIHESLVKVGISTRYIEEIRHEHTGISFEVQSEHQKQFYFDPGANLGHSDFKIPIDYYLHLCDAVIVNKWCSLELRNEVLQAAQVNSIPNIYVQSGLPHDEEKNLPIDYLFLDFSIENQNLLQTINLKDYLIRKGIFVFKKGEITTISPNGAECYILNLPVELNADFVVTRIMATLTPRIKLSDTAAFTKMFT